MIVVYGVRFAGPDEDASGGGKRAAVAITRSPCLSITSYGRTADGPSRSNKAYIVMSYVGMAFIVMSYVGMPYIVMSYVVWPI